MNGTGFIGTARNFCRTCSYASRQHHRLQILAAAPFPPPAMLRYGAQWGDMVTMACARPDRDPEMPALDHIPPLGPARGASAGCIGRCWGARGVLPRPPERGNTPLAPQQRTMQPAPGTAVWLTCPAHPDWSRAAGLPPLARTGALRGRTVSCRERRPLRWKRLPA